MQPIGRLVCLCVVLAAWLGGCVGRQGPGPETGVRSAAEAGSEDGRALAETSDERSATAPAGLDVVDAELAEPPAPAADADRFVPVAGLPPPPLPGEPSTPLATGLLPPGRHTTTLDSDAVVLDEHEATEEDAGGTSDDRHGAGRATMTGARPTRRPGRTGGRAARLDSASRPVPTDGERPPTPRAKVGAPARLARPATTPPAEPPAAERPAEGGALGGESFRDELGAYRGGTTGEETVALDGAREALVAQQVARQLTAATVADVDRRGEFLGYLGRHVEEAALLGLDMTRRVRLQVVDAEGRPIHDAVLTLVGSGVRVTGRTHGDGYWDFFPSVQAPQAAGRMDLYIQAGSVTARAPVDIPAGGDGHDVVVRLPQTRAAAPRALDLAFLIDVTGSMGDELAYVNAEVMGIVERVQAAVPQVSVRVAATFYRDRGDLVPVEQIPFSTDVRAFMTRMSYVRADGGGDYAEDVNTGLAAALTTLAWSEGPAARVLVHIADAPPQRYDDFQFTYRDAMLLASARGIRLLPVAASGADRVVEYLFRAMGAFTSTPYVYLTDDSGVGGHHMEADTERISIEMFSDCLTRLLVADLRGEGMHDPTYQGQQGVLLPRG